MVELISIHPVSNAFLQTCIRIVPVHKLLQLVPSYRIPRQLGGSRSYRSRTTDFFGQPRSTISRTSVALILFPVHLAPGYWVDSSVLCFHGLLRRRSRTHLCGVLLGRTTWTSLGCLSQAAMLDRVVARSIVDVGRLFRE